VGGILLSSRDDKVNFRLRKDGLGELQKVAL
jgi:hypothetical protein